MVKISVIMPVYNDEENLENAINSILNQTLDDIEILCINDGSTDNSLKILNDFSKKDQRIKVFTKENSGSGASRNLGILKAKGEYIAFLDSDDFMVDKNALFELYDNAKKTGMIMVSGGIQFIEKGEVLTEVRCFKPIKRLSIKSVGEFCVPWYFYKSIFKREFLIENDIKFPDLLRGQDPIFFLDILTRIENYLEVPVLYYSYKSPSENKINDSKKYHDYFVHFYEVFKLITPNNVFNKMINEYSEFLTTMKNRKVYIFNKQELLDLLSIMDKIIEVFVNYGDEIILKNVVSSFDEIIGQINLDNIDILINSHENITDIYSEAIVVIDKLFNPKISFVLPVYNVEDYLSECLDSVINQSLKDIEIICINDESTDSSLEILEDYANQDSRIKIFTFKNKGLGPARNRGVNRAHGEYVAFIDTDDWIELDFAEKIYETAIKTDADIVLFNAVEEYENHKKERIYFKEGLIPNPENFVFDFRWNSSFVLNNYFTAWSKLHRTKFLQEKKIEFPATIFEDMEFQVESFLKTRKIAYNPHIFYHYRKNNTKSIMNSLRGDDVFCVIDIMDRIYFHLKDQNVYERFEFDFLRLKIKTFQDKFNSLNFVLKSEFYSRIKKDFLNMNLEENKLNKLHSEISNFYRNIIKFEDYWEYYVYFENIENASDFTLNKSDDVGKEITLKNDELIKMNQKLNEEISNLKKDNESLVNMLNEYTNEVNNLKNNNKLLASNNTELLNNYSSLENTIKTLNFEIKDKSNTISKIQDDYYILSKNFKNQNIKISFLNDKIEFLENKYSHDMESNKKSLLNRLIK